jgi:DNA-binding transcriptional ArsR family regulator
MLVMPFLSESQLQELEGEGISGIDLCGNGVVVVPGMFSVFRSGEPNGFSSSAPIKNIYRKNSSMVGRIFLARSGYDTVQEICAEINRRNMLVNRWDKKPMSLSTVSKALKTLEQDLIVDRTGFIRLLQPDTLLEKLAKNYAPPKIRERVRLKVSEESGKIRELLLKQSHELGLTLVAAGTSSVSQFAVMQRADLLSVYCPRLEMLLERLPGSQSDCFPNLELVETEDETVYFDARQEGNFWWVSPVQVYLELLAGDKRDQETAEQVKSFLLTDLQAVRQ